MKIDKNILFIEDYIEFLVAQKNLTRNTCQSYFNDIKQFVTFFKNKPLISISESNIKNYLKSLSRNFSPSSHARKLSTLKQFYNFLVNEKKINKNPFLNFDFPKSKKKLPSVLSENEISIIFDYSYKDSSNYGLRFISMIEIMYATGIRVSELVELKVSSLKEDFSSIIVKGKGNKERYIPLTDKAKLSIIKYLKIREFFLNKKLADKGFLFPTNFKNTNMTRIRFFQILKDICLKININPERVSPHVIRHSFATHLLDRGVDLRIIQSSLGHADISTTQIYTHVQTKKLKKIIENKHPLKSSFKKLSEF